MLFCFWCKCSCRLGGVVFWVKVVSQPPVLHGDWEGMSGLWPSCRASMNSSRGDRTVSWEESWRTVSAGLPQHVVSKGFAEAWVCARLHSSKASVASRGLTELTFLELVLRWRSADNHEEAGRTFWGSITLLSVSFSRCLLAEMGWWEDSGLHQPLTWPTRAVPVYPL